MIPHMDVKGGPNSPFISEGEQIIEAKIAIVKHSVDRIRSVDSNNPVTGLFDLLGSQTVAFVRSESRAGRGGLLALDAIVTTLVDIMLIIGS